MNKVYKLVIEPLKVSLIIFFLPVLAIGAFIIDTLNEEK